MIKNFDLNNLPEVKLVGKGKLPTVAGIYFAVDRFDRIWYIGQAQNINKRWHNHHRFYQLAKLDIGQGQSIVARN